MKTLFITFDLNAIDAHALVIIIVTYIVVFLFLALIGFIFSHFYRIMNYYYKHRWEKGKKKENVETPRQKITGDENAAIAAALYLFFSELHDEEKYVMTIKKVSRNYSPWNSKIYSIWNSLKNT
ncbi:MAG: OadG family protein [Bacteroidetes bacterium]|nr:OadG family protein [Bacteroidota bacterium]